MKKRILAALLAGMVFASSAILAYAETEDNKFGSLWEPIPPVIDDSVTTGTQEKAQEEATDVDADIKEEVLANIPDSIEEIKISNADEFMDFVDHCKLDTWSANKKVVITDDFSLVGKNFKGIPSFGGYFDGQGHTISEINLKSGLSYVGFFTHIQKNAIVTDLNVTGSVIPSGTTTIVGGFCGQNSGLINGCSFKGVVSGKDYIGGIVGINELTGDIRFCTSEGFLSGTHFIGGIAGKNDGNIANCRNEAMVNTTNTDTEVTIDSMENLNSILNLIKNGLDKEDDEASADVTVSDAGGIAGVSIGIISRCINNGDIGYDHVGYNIGGIAGRQSGYVANCSNNGNIKGRKDIGGIVGQAEPYITVDFATDIAYQLSEAVAQLHDTVAATLNDTKNQSDVVSSRLAVIQKFTGQAVEDTRYIANGTVDFANDVASSTNDAFSRVEYILDESTKDGGVFDNLTDAAGSTKKSAAGMKKTVGDLDIDNYITSDDEKEQYNNAKTLLLDAATQYEENYAKKVNCEYNEYLRLHRSGDNADIRMYDSSDNPYDETGWDDDDCDLVPYPQGAAQSGTWKHSTDMVKFPVSNSEDTRYAADNELHQDALKHAQNQADIYAKNAYVNPMSGDSGSAAYRDTLESQSQVLGAIYLNHMDEMSEQTRKDGQIAMNDLGAAADSLEKAGKQTKEMFGDVAGRSDIRYPQFSDEYKAHTNSLADNLAAMNDNFGLLNAEMNNATGVITDDLQTVNDQFNNILNLYTDALDGVLEKDYTNMFSDDSLSEASYTTDATVDSCFNFGICRGDIDVSGIAGTMAIEYDFDKESDVTGLKDSGLNGSYLTKCVLRDNRNYGDIVSEKNYAGGVCGLQEMGTILNCGSYSSVKSTSGSYVGGVAGSSISNIMESYAKGELKGNSYVGGVAGDGKHMKECLTIVSIDGEPDYSGAIAGHVAESGEVRENYFVSDTLAGLDRVSYSKKAEPVSYNKVIENTVFKSIEKETEQKEETEEQEAKVVNLNTGSDGTQTAEENYRSLPHEFSNINVNFVLEDEDLENGTEKVAKISKQYGDKLTLDDYPGVKHKEGYYVAWDTTQIDKLVHDVTVTANYKRYKTTLAETDVSDDVHQSELLVDGRFKEEDELVVEKTVYVTEESVSAHLDNYETLKVTVPDDGQKTHQIRFKAINSYADLAAVMGGFFGGEPVLYLVENGKRTELKKTGSVGEYATYDVDGNNFMLSVSIEGARNAAVTVVVIIGLAVLLLIGLLIVIINIIKRHGGTVPKIFNRFIIKVSERIENKEQLFYDDSHDSETGDLDSEDDYSKYYDPDEADFSSDNEDYYEDEDNYDDQDYDEADGFNKDED